MRIIVMGCGRVGEQVSRLMADEGHQVAVVDYNADALARLGPNFKGLRIKGVGFDRNVLIEAGIENTDAFAATSSSDNANIVAARIARHIFRVPRVVARLYNPQRVEIYRRLGLMTISSTTWGAERIRELLLHKDLDPAITFGNGEVSMMTIETPVHLIGRLVKDVTIPGEVSVVAITRQGQAFIPFQGTEFRSGDSIHLVILSSAMNRLEALFRISEGN